MRKFSKGAAITGGIFCIISLVLNLISTVTNIITMTKYGTTAALTSTLTTAILTLLVFILLAIVLFRRKADTFAGVVFALLGAYALFNLIGTVTAFSSYKLAGISQTPLYFGLVSNLLRVLMYILMALHCFRKNAGKTPLYGIGFILVALISTVQAVAQMIAYNGFDSYMIVILISTAFGSIIGALPMVLAGFAVGNAKADAPVNPADPYGLYAQYGIQPPVSTPDSQSVIDSYQAQYQAPQQNTWQQPQYQAPQQSWQQPQYQPNQQNTWQQPQYQAPQQQSWQQPEEKPEQ